MDWNRRQVVRAAGAGLFALSLPGWLAACCARRDAEAPPEVITAAAKGRGVLFLHVEDDERRSDDLGRLVGTFLLHATDEQLAPLATVELACATTREIAAMAPHLAGRSDVRAVFVPPQGPAVCAVSGNPPQVEWDPSIDGILERSVQRRHEWIAHEWKNAFGAGANDLERRAAEERARIGSSPEAEIPQLEFARRWPNQARWIAEQEPERRAGWISALAQVAGERWKVAAPAGSTWATSTGCGIRYERPAPGTPHIGYACGMGHVPPISQRFLHFFTAEEARG